MLDASQRHRTPRRARARTGAYHGRPGSREARGTAPPGKHSGVSAMIRSWRDVSCVTGRDPGRARETGQRAARRVPKGWRADVGRHAAAAGSGGKGIRVDGQYRTLVRGPEATKNHDLRKTPWRIAA